MLRIGRLPEAWIAPPETRELRELVRYRAKLVALRTGLKAQIHAVLAKEGIIPQLKELWGPGGARELNSLELADAYHIRLDSLRELVGRYDHEVKLMDAAFTAGWSTTTATARSRASTAWAGPLPPSSWLRSVT